MGKTQIDEDSQFDYGDQDHRQGDAFFYQQNNQENSYNRNGIYHFEVMVGCFDHVLHTGSFSNEHSVGVGIYMLS